MASARGAKSARQAGVVLDGAHLRLHKEGEVRYCTLSSYEFDEDECGTWNALHSGWTEAWGAGHSKGKGAQKVQLEQSVLTSMYNLVARNKVALPVSADQGAITLFQGVRVSVLLKASAISGRALSATVLENLHENRKYANDLRNVMSLLQPGLVDMGAQVGAVEACPRRMLLTYSFALDRLELCWRAASSLCVADGCILLALHVPATSLKAPVSTEQE